MSVYKNERELVKSLVKVWKNFNPYPNINLASYRIGAVYQKWYNTILPELPQPEIDIITCHEHGKALHAMEVKYFRLTKGGINYPFYEGLGEAIALLRFGFDAAHLLHIFDEEIASERMNAYASSMNKLLTKL